ncbi:putative dehydrogenase [Tepidamorphus gemmatus]|uniref:Putative dehydrogenase n=1 Tax=Tepidamorphus gemmatus TaxID=747076 RepID=A0A4R3MB07_9HYPH|nr:putative dehydrogenase [Tepidamorphus gemmatus]
MTDMGQPIDYNTAPIRLGMVGGGEGAFIGTVHRYAARLDGEYRLIAGALSSDPERAKASGAALGLDPARTYADFRVMARRERRLKDGIEAVTIVTPNHMHFPVAKAFLKAGIHVICDKPMVASSREARALRKLVEVSGALFACTYNYSGYPMVRQAREMVAAGEIGAIRVVQVEYLQDWLTEPIEASGQKQAEWRMDPARSGGAGAIGDIGTHAFQLATFVTGLEPVELSADLAAFVEGRRVDDNAQVMLRFAGGARGMLWASQVAPGNENGLKLRVYGARGGLEWSQEDPNRLWVTRYGEPKRLISRGGAGAGAAAQRITRIPAGHPEGFLEAFANIYAEVARAIRARRAGKAVDPAVLFPGIEDGARGVAFIEACLRSSRAKGRWVPI